ncbi:uncharacterized protein LOC127105164 isoform X1 [Lathyrus oleraceus]|uniref:CBM20 domain-containing protein n=1 Tax=Pisum sativum TaxID=3888 RepID=A0A9D5A1I7_PEA|nr:uncharacterized protein LOC127105164 isoform X1 [Pisum sativum]KAI5392031.1 hypothetical protein KIW84_076718 [Pisum sativum]
MKAFTSFSSKPINLKLRSLSPRVDFHVSDRPFSCFTIPFRNEQKGSIFCVLKVVQNRGFYPLHAVPSEHQQEVELEAVEPQVQQSEQTNESKLVRIEFRLLKDCDFGEQFLIVGDDPMLGSWNPLDALLMTWSDGHIWTLELDMPAGKSIQYKFILKGIEDDIIWQPGSDRIIQTWETMNRIIVYEDWENAELQKVIEEDKFSQSNEEPQVLSELSTFTETLDDSRDKMEFVVSSVSGIEDTRIHDKQKLIDEQVLQQITGDIISSSIEKPMAIIAENIGSSDDRLKSTSHMTNKSNVIRKSEGSEDGSQKDDKIRYSGYNGNAAALNNQEGTIVEGSLIDLKGGPVLVPGLMQPTEKEADRGEVVEEEKTAIKSLTETFETHDQIIPEDQESDDDTAEEINTTINDELSFHEEQFHLAPTMEETSNAEPIHGNALRNDVEWGRETVKKFLTKFGLL